MWAELGRADRAVAELQSLFTEQAPDGFVPHMRYVGAPDTATEFWGRPETSSVTQPPMFGHAVAELHRRGVDVGSLVDAARAGVQFLLDRPRTGAGLVPLVHPWESGCDDSPRWDDQCPGGPDPERWYAEKGRLVQTIVTSGFGSPLANPEFAVGSAAFTALVAFNALELASVIDDAALTSGGREVGDALTDRFDPALVTWVDDGPTADSSGRVRTAEALLPTLLDLPGSPDAFAALGDPEGLGAPFGPRQVDRREPAYDPDRYWRGPAWPQINYLLWLALTRSGSSAKSSMKIIRGLERSMVSGVEASGFAEYWNADTGAGLGAIPQSWSTLAVLMT